MKKQFDAIQFGKVLRKLRVSKHWTQKQLGLRIGVGSQTISGYERGKTQVTVAILSSYANLFPDQIYSYLIDPEEHLIAVSEEEELLLSFLRQNYSLRKRPTQLLSEKKGVYRY